jgi:hypothetical protein
MNEDISLTAFKAINTFVDDLSEAFGKIHKPLKLYKRLINRTYVTHEEAIKKHITLFKNFCFANRDALSEQSCNKITEGKVCYSERVYIDIKYIMEKADDDTLSVIWKHLLTISALVDPLGKARDILRKNSEEDKSPSKESDFLANIISKVEKNVKSDSNPLEAVMQSGIFNDILSGMKDGKFDIGKLLGVAQNMASKMNEQANDPESKQAMGMLNSVLGSLNQGGGGAPDMSGMMSMMMGLMGGQNSSLPKIEEIIPEKKQ